MPISTSPIALTLPEFTSGADPVVVCTISHPDDPVDAQYEVLGGVNSPFTIIQDGTEYKLALKARSTLDYETAKDHMAKVTIAIHTADDEVLRKVNITLTDVNETPELQVPTGIPSVSDDALVKPFSDIVLRDQDIGDELTVTITFDAGQGALSNLGTGHYDAAAGTYTVTGSLDAVRAALKDLTFDPTDRVAAAGTKELVNFTLTVQDKGGLTAQSALGIESVTREQKPDSIMLSNAVIDESETSIVVGAITANDHNGDALTFALADQDGNDIDDDHFALQATTQDGKTIYQLVTKPGLLVTSTAYHDIWVKVSDHPGSYTLQKFTITVRDIPVNVAPTDIKLDNLIDVTVTENTAYVGQLSATDTDGPATLSYVFDLDAANGGNAGGMFVIDGTQIKLADGKALDYETKTAYTIYIKAFDGEKYSTTQTITINLSDINEKPYDITFDNAGTALKVGVATASGAQIIDAHAQDHDSTSGFANNKYSFADGQLTALDGLLVIDPDTGRVTTTRALALTDSGHKTISVKAYDAGNAALFHIENYSFDITAPAAPTDVRLDHATSLDVTENTAFSGQLSANVDGDATGLSFAFDGSAEGGGNANGLFAIDPTTKAIVLASGRELDYEAGSTYTIYVKAFDGFHYSAPQAITIHLTDVNEAPTAITFSDVATIRAGTTSSNAMVVQATAVDPDLAPDFKHNTYSFANNELTDGLFTIDAITGIITTNRVVGDADVGTHRLTVVTHDGNLTYSTTKDIAVLADDNTKPHTITVVGGGTSANVAENEQPNHVVAQITASDNGPAGELRYSIADNALFGINEATGEIYIKANAVLNYEGTTSYTVSVTVRDKNGTGLISDEQQITIHLTDVNEAATDITFSNAGTLLKVGAASGALQIIDAQAVDPDSVASGFTNNAYSFADDTTQSGNGLLQIDPATGRVTTARALTAADVGEHTINVKVYDVGTPSLFYTKTYTFTIADADPPAPVNQAPTAVTVTGTHTIAENVDGAEIGTLGATDDDGVADGIFTYAFDNTVDGNNNDKFALVDGKLVLAANTHLDFEALDLKTDDEGATRYYLVALKASETIDGVTKTQTTATTIKVYVDNDPADDAPVPVNQAPTVTNNIIALETNHNANGAQDLVHPFAQVTVGDDAFNGAEVTVTITLNNKDFGEILIDQGEEGAFDPATGIYTITGTVDEVNDALRMLRYDPRDRDAGDGDETTTFTVQVSDGVNTATNANEISVISHAADAAPVNTAPTAVTVSGTHIIAENVNGAEIGVLGATDEDGVTDGVFTYAFDDTVAGNNNAKFAIVDGKLVLAAGTHLDFEDVNLKTDDDGATRYFEVALKATENGNLTQATATTVKVFVTDANDAADDITFTGAAANLRVGADSGAINFQVLDADAVDADTKADFLVNKYSFADNTLTALNGLVAIDPTLGVVKLTRALTAADVAADKTFTVKAYDGANAADATLFTTKVFTFSILAADAQEPTNEAPTAVTVSGNHTIVENVKNAEIGVLSAVDDDEVTDGIFTYEFDNSVDGNKNAKFAIRDGKLILATDTHLDYEATDLKVEAGTNRKYYEVALKATETLDGVAKTQATATIIKVYVTNDPTDDPVSPPANQAPTVVTLSTNTIAENVYNAEIGTLGATDDDGVDDGIFTYAFDNGVAGNNNAKFALSADGTKLVLATGTSLDYEAADLKADANGKYYEVALKATETLNGEVKTQATATVIKVYVTNDPTDDVVVNPPPPPPVNHAPTDVTLSGNLVKELSAEKTVVGSLAGVDADAANTFTYKLTDDAMGRFVIDGDKVMVRNGFDIDFEQSTSHVIKVMATDQGGLSVEKQITINVQDVNPEVTAGSAANDRIFGGAGKDNLSGGAGDDTLGGGLGNDKLNGGAGKDSFVFNTKPGNKNVDTIVQYEKADVGLLLDDTIFKNKALTKLGKKGLLDKPLQIKKSMFASFEKVENKQQDADDYFIFKKDTKKGTGELYFDKDGSGAAKAVLVTKFDKLKTTFDYKDLFLI